MDNKLENKVIIKRLLAVVKPYQTRAWLALLSMALTAATQPLLGKALQLLIDLGFEEKVPFSLWWIPGVLVSIFILRGIGTFSTAYLNNWVTSRVLNDLRAMVFDRVLRLPVARFHVGRHRTAKTKSTITDQPQGSRIGHN